MTDTTEKLPKEPAGDLEPTQVTDDAAAAIRGGAAEGQLFNVLVETINSAVSAVGASLNRTARQG